MTMPMTAEAVRCYDAGCLPADMVDDQLSEVIKALRRDLPGAVELIESAVLSHNAGSQEFSYTSRSPAELSGGRKEWDQLVGYVARLFASPFALVAKEYVWRNYGRDVAFVNCCIIAVGDGEIDAHRLFELQVAQQVTPDC